MICHSTSTVSKLWNGPLSLLENDHLLLTRDDAQARAEIARFSKRDADRIEQFEEEISAVAIALRELATQAPPDFGGGWRDLMQLLSAGNVARKLGSHSQKVLAT